MNTLNLTTVVTALVVAVSLGTVSAHADGTSVAAMLGGGDLDDRASGPLDGPAVVEATATNAQAGEWALLDPISDGRFDSDRSGRDTVPYASQFALGPQYPLNKRVTLGGEWEPLQPAFVRGRPELDQYTFNLRIAF